MFQLNAPVVIRVKVKEVWTNITIYSPMHYWGYTSLEVKGRWELLLLPCLLITAVQQPGTSSPPSLLKHSSEGVIWMYRASFTSSSCPLVMMTGAVQLTRLFSELKLVTDNLPLCLCKSQLRSHWKQLSLSILSVDLGCFEFLFDPGRKCFYWQDVSDCSLSQVNAGVVPSDNLQYLTVLEQ